MSEFAPEDRCVLSGCRSPRCPDHGYPAPPVTDETVEQLATVAVSRLKPHPVTTWNRETQEYEVTHEWGPDDSTMIVFRADDGHNSMRALSFREVFASVSDHLAAQDTTGGA